MKKPETTITIGPHQWLALLLILFAAEWACERRKLERAVHEEHKNSTSAPFGWYSTK